MASTLETLVIRLTADASRLQAELGKAERDTKQSGKRIGESFATAFRSAAQFGATAVVGITAVGTALTVAANKAAAYADEIDKTAIRTRLSRDTLQELAFAADQAGVGFSSIEANIRAFTGRLAEAERGSVTVAATFDRLGVALRDQNGALRDTEALFLDTLTALSGVENETSRAALAVQAFGEQGSALLPFLTQGAGGLEDLRQKARDLGLVLSGESIDALVQYKDQLSAVQQQFGALGRDITTNFLPVLSQGLLPAVQDAVIPALRDLIERSVGVADAFDETGAPTEDFKNRIEDIAGAVGGLVTDLVALGEVSVGLVQVITSPFAALGNVLGQLSVGVPNFFDAYRRAFSGDLSGFQGRPIDTLLPNIEDVLAVALEQANTGLAGVRAGAARFGSFTPGSGASGSFTPPIRTSGVSGVGVGAPGVAGPTGAPSDPVTVIAPSLNRTLEDAGLVGLSAINADRQATLAAIGANLISDRGRTRGSGLMAGGDLFTPPGSGSMFPTGAAAQFILGDVQARQQAEAALIESVRDAGATRRQAYAIEVQATATAAAEVAAAEEAANSALIASVREAGNARRRAYTIEAIAEGDAARAARADLLDRIGAGAISDRGRTRGEPSFGNVAGGVFTPAAVPPEIQALIDVGAKVRLELEQGAQNAALIDQAAALETKQALITGGLQAAQNLADAVRSGSPSGIFGAAASGIGSVLSVFNPLAGQLFGLFGGFAAGLLPNGRQESEAARAVGANVSGAPSISISVAQNISLAVASLVGSDARASFDRANSDLLRLIETNVIPRLGRLEAKTGGA